MGELIEVERSIVAQEIYWHQPCGCVVTVEFANGSISSALDNVDCKKSH